MPQIEYEHQPSAQQSFSLADSLHVIEQALMKGEIRASAGIKTGVQRLREQLWHEEDEQLPLTT
jgi:hypothetical protein